MRGPSTYCYLADGSPGYVIFVDAYLSNQPVSASASGGDDMNVTADIFVGAVLVLCLALGWIAGAQR
jgi:hypothetical protein